MKWIKEEHLMHILYWLSPILGAIISTILLFENSAQDNSFAFFSVTAERLHLSQKCFPN